MRNTCIYKTLIENLEGRDHLGDPDVDRRITFIRVLNK
jgi:hypothetical protein